MAKIAFNIDDLTRGQQVLFAAVVLGGALFVGSLLFLIFAIPNNWLTPAPRTVYERNIVAAQQAVTDARKEHGTAPDETGRNPYAEAQAQLIFARLEAGQTARAVREAEALHKKYPNHAYIGLAYGRALFESMEYLKAQEVINRFIDSIESVAPELQRGIRSLQAQLYREQKDIEGACQAYLDAARISPASLELYLQAAELAYAHEKWELAVEAFASALAYDTDSIHVQDALMVSRAKDEDAFQRGAQKALDVTGVDVREVLW
jgi:tetratricopeptide (TPR) repeat protein